MYKNSRGKTPRMEAFYFITFLFYCIFILLPKLSPLTILTLHTEISPSEQECLQLAPENRKTSKPWQIAQGHTLVSPPAVREWVLKVNQHFKKFLWRYWSQMIRGPNGRREEIPKCAWWLVSCFQNNFFASCLHTGFLISHHLAGGNSLLPLPSPLCFSVPVSVKSIPLVI